MQDLASLVLSNRRFAYEILRQGPRIRIRLSDKRWWSSWPEFLWVVDPGFLEASSRVNASFRDARLRIEAEEKLYTAEDAFESDDAYPDQFSDARYFLFIPDHNEDNDFGPDLRSFLSRAPNLKRAYVDLSRIARDTRDCSRAVTSLVEGLQHTKMLTHLSLCYDEGLVVLNDLKLPPSLAYLNVISYGAEIRGQLFAPPTLKTLVLDIRDRRRSIESEKYHLYVPRSVTHLILHQTIQHIVNVEHDLKRLTLIDASCSNVLDFSLKLLKRTKSLACVQKPSGYGVGDTYLDIGSVDMTDPAHRKVLDGYREALSHIEESKNVAFVVTLYLYPLSHVATLYPKNAVKISLRGTWFNTRLHLTQMPRLRYLNACIRDETYQHIDLRDFPQLRSVKLAGRFRARVWLNEGLERFVLDPACDVTLEGLPSTLKEFAPNGYYIPKRGTYPDSLARFTIWVLLVSEVSFDDLPPNIETLTVRLHNPEQKVPGSLKLTGTCPRTLRHLRARFHILSEDSVLPDHVRVDSFALV